MPPSPPPINAIAITFNIADKTTELVDSPCLDYDGNLFRDKDIVFVSFQETRVGFPESTHLTSKLLGCFREKGFVMIANKVSGMPGIAFATRLYIYVREHLVQRIKVLRVGKMRHTLSKRTCFADLLIDNVHKMTAICSHLPFNKKDQTDATLRTKCLGDIRKTIVEPRGNTPKRSWFLFGDLNFRNVQSNTNAMKIVDQGDEAIDVTFGPAVRQGKTDKPTCKLDTDKCDNGNRYNCKNSYVGNRSRSLCDRFVYYDEGTYQNVKTQELPRGNWDNVISDHLPIMMTWTVR